MTGYRSTDTVQVIVNLSTIRILTGNSACHKINPVLLGGKVLYKVNHGLKFGFYVLSLVGKSPEGFRVNCKRWSCGSFHVVDADVEIGPGIIARRGRARTLLGPELAGGHGRTGGSGIQSCHGV